MESWLRCFPRGGDDTLVVAAGVMPRSCVPRGAARCRDLAERIAYTCWQMYEAQPSGIGPERVKGLKIDLSRTDTKECV